MKKITILLTAYIVLASVISFADEMPTRYDPVGKSLEQLLNDEWKIVSGLWPGLILEKKGKYIFCFTEHLPRKKVSDCNHLN